MARTIDRIDVTTMACRANAQLAGDESLALNDRDIVLELKVALRRSRLLQRMQEFRSAHSQPIHSKTTNDRARLNKPDLMLRVKNASELFVALLSTLSDEKKSSLKHMQLHDLLDKRTWLNVLIANARRPTPQADFEVLHNKLLFIDEYPLADTTHSPPKNAAIPAVSAVSAELKYTRRCAVTACLCGVLTLLIAFLSCAPFLADIWGTLLAWSSSSKMEYRTALALLVLGLSIAGFQLITYITTPVQSQANTAAQSTKSTKIELKVSLRRAFAGCIGPLLLGFGTGISASAGFGAFGLTVMLDGLYTTYGVPYWVSQTVLSIACYLLAWKWARIPLGLGTVPALLLIGPAISFGAGLTNMDPGFAGNLLAFIAGTLIFSFGIALSAAAALGPDSLTALSLAAEDAGKWPIPRSTFFFNVAAIAIGIALAGNFGIATVLNLLALPLLLHYQIPPLRQFLQP